MKKRFARPLAGLLAFSVCLSSFALPALAEGPELSSDEGDAEYSITLYIEEGEDEPEQTGSGDASPTEEDETDAGTAGGTVETVSSTEEETVTDPETGAVTTTTTTKTEWSGTDEDGLDVEGEGTRTETVTTGTETTDGPQPGQTTTTTTTDTVWKEEAGQTGAGETDSPDPGTTIETETKTEVTGSENRTDSVTTDAQDRVVEEFGSYEGSETTTTGTTDERTHTEIVSAETKVEEGKPTIKEQEEHTYIDESSVTPSPSAPPEELDIDGDNYAGTEVTLTPGGTDSTEIPVDTSKYEPTVTPEETSGTDADGKAFVKKTVLTTSEDGKTTTGYTVTTTYPGKPGETVTETVVYDRDADGNFIGYTSTTVVSKPHLDKTETSSEVTVPTESITVEDAEQPEPEEPEEVTIILVPEKPAESETTDAAGNTTKVTVENLYDTDGKTVIGYQVKTTVTGADGKQVSTASESVWGTRTTVTTTTVTNYTTTETTTEKVTTVKTEQFMQGVTESKVEIRATAGELKASMGAVNGETEVLYDYLETLQSAYDASQKGTYDDDNDLYYRGNKKKPDDTYASYNPDGETIQWLGEYGMESTFRVATNSYSPGYQAHQFILKDAEGNLYYAYCTDLEVDATPAEFNVARLEDSGFYKEGDEAHIRAIALNGYWGTESGTGSLEEFKKTLAASGKFTTEQLDKITPGMAVTATQAAIWYYGNSGNDSLSDKFVTGWHFTSATGHVDATSEEATLINAMYQYLIALEEKPTTDNTLINQDVFAQEVKIKLNGKVGTNTQNTSDSGSEEGKYDVDLTFTMGLEVVSGENGDDLIVSVVLLDKDGKQVTGEDGKPITVATGTLNGENSTGLKYDSKTNSYTFSNIVLESGTKLDLRLDGTQNLQEGVYLFSAKGGYTEAQTFVGVGAAKQNVSLNVNLEFNVTDPVATQSTTTTTYNQLYETTTTTEFERLTTVTVKSAEITVTEQTTDEQHREWEGEYHHTYTYDEPEKPESPDEPDKPVIPFIPVVPVVPETPAEVEEVSVKTEIPAAPQATLPQTGQNWAMVGFLTFAGVLLAGAGVRTGKRREDEHEA